MNWWLAKGRNGVHSVLLQCIPTVICWEIWLNTCAARFDNKPMSGRHIIRQVSNYLTLILRCQFPNLQLPQLWIDKCQYVEKLQLSIHSQAVRWSKPDRGWVKLNVDGCSKGNPGLAGGGGIIRDHHGNMMKAFAEFYGPCSNNLAEAKALLHGVKLCSNSGFLKVHVESDSMFTVNMINKRMLPSWQIKHIIEQIWEVTSTGDFKFTHTFREGNTVADQLANLGVNSQNCAIFNEVVLLPTKVRASMKLDQDGLPNFLFKPRRNNFVINDDIN
ncbi:uncharacterized protein [Nicotiana sylvestris]|uniref:uncharacterized protein n=1 Tax=Nicotiana sylvestris TaxID=4096 RepID=UPI00388C7AF9